MATTRQARAGHEPREVAQSVGSEIRQALGERLLGLYLHGSVVSGDFAPGRSDLDLLAVLADDPDTDVLARLADVHTRVATEHVAWQGRIEVEYVGLGALSDAASSGPPAHTLARISPGEPLHLLPSSPHRLLGWDTVGRTGQVVLGPPAAELIPRFDPRAVRRAALEHVRDWPAWARDMHLVGGQVYSVLSVGRAYCLFVLGAQYSKKRAAVEVAAAEPRWAEVVTWAMRWWYAEGSDDAAVRPDEVVAFVDEACARIIAVEAAEGRHGQAP